MKRQTGLCLQQKRPYVRPKHTAIGRLAALAVDGMASCQLQPDGTLMLRFPGCADFILGVTGAVECIPLPEAGDAWRAIYEHQVQPLVLSQRGAPVFRGAAIGNGGKAVGFLGLSGRGESTLAAAFARRGHALLGSDFLHLDLSGPRVLVQPQAEHVRLWEESASAARDAASDVAGSAPLRLGSVESMRGCDQALPLSRVYLVGEGDVDTLVLSPILPPQQLVGWTSNAFVLDTRDPDVLERNLAVAARLVGEVPMRGLVCPRNRDLLDEVVDAVLADMAA